MEILHCCWYSCRGRGRGCSAGGQRAECGGGRVGVAAELSAPGHPSEPPTGGT